jgi:hypothetical protein
VSTALLVIYIITLLLIGVAGAFAAMFYRDLVQRFENTARELQAVRGELGATQESMRALTGLPGAVEAARGARSDTSARIEHLERVYERVAAEQGGLSTRVGDAESRARGLAEMVGGAQRQVRYLAESLTDLERGSLQTLTEAVSTLQRTSWELGVAQTSRQIPDRPWLPGHLHLPAGADNDAIPELYVAAAGAVGLEVTFPPPSNLADGYGVIGLRTSAGGGGVALGELEARFAEYLDHAAAGSIPAENDILGDLLAAVGATPGASVLLANLLCVGDDAGTRVRLFTAAELAEVAGTGHIRLGADRSAGGRGREVEVETWTRQRRDQVRRQAERSEAIRLLAEELRPQIERDLRLRLEEEEGLKIEQELRAELEPIVRRELERRLRGTVDAQDD